MPVIGTNTAANSALRYLNYNSDNQSSTLAKLASGSRIVKASDDASSLAVGTRVQSDITTLGQAATNAANASSILSVADGGMARISDILQRMKSLATQSNSGSVTDDQRAYLNSEFGELIKEIGSIATGTRYNGESLLDGSSTKLDFETGVDIQVGTTTADVINVKISAVDATTLAVNSSKIDTQANAKTAVGEIDTAIGTLTTARASVGALMSRFDYHAEAIATSSENLSAVQSSLMDADVAAEKSNLSTWDVKTQASIAALTQATQMPQELLSLLQS